MPRSYVGLSALKSRIDLSDTDDDALLRAVLEGVAEAIDHLCGRTFQPFTATRYLSSTSGSLLSLDEDLLSVTTLKTDVNGQYTWGTTWASTDYDLEPWDAPDRKRPYRWLRVHPTGTQSFPTTRKGVQLVGLWGYWLDTASVGTLGAAISDTTGTSVTMASGHSVEAGMTLRIDSEQLYTSAVSVTTLTVERGVNGTTAATHANGASVARYRYPNPVREAALLQAVRLWRRKDAPFGVAGSAEMGQFTSIPKLDPDVRLLLAPYRRIDVGTA